jgi:RNA polymerase sigma-70 factor (ECF subfamily)
MASKEKRFTKLVNDHSNEVLRYLRNRIKVGSMIEAEDLLAEVMTVAWRALDQVPAEAELAWLYAVARNRLLSEKSKLSRRSRILNRIRPIGQMPGVEDAVIADIAVKRALDCMGATSRDVLLLSVWEGLSPSDIAIALGISANAAAVRLSRAKSTFILAFHSELSENSAPLTDNN